MASPVVDMPENPVIDLVWYAKEMARLKASLLAEFPGVPGQTVTAALDLATQKIAVPARIPNYLPVLVRREARALLRGRPVDADEL
jgi:hypothetical protein